MSEEDDDKGVVTLKEIREEPYYGHVTPKAVLEGAVVHNLERCLVSGITEDGTFYAAASDSDVWLNVELLRNFLTCMLEAKKEE